MIFSSRSKHHYDTVPVTPLRQHASLALGALTACIGVLPNFVQNTHTDSHVYVHVSKILLTGQHPIRSAQVVRKRLKQQPVARLPIVLARIVNQSDVALMTPPRACCRGQLGFPYSEPLVS